MIWKRYGLKAQKLIAQGNALGKRVLWCTPCKGKSKLNILKVKCFCPFRAQVISVLQSQGVALG